MLQAKFALLIIFLSSSVVVFSQNFGVSTSQSTLHAQLFSTEWQRVLIDKKESVENSLVESESNIAGASNYSTLQFEEKSVLPLAFYPKEVYKDENVQLSFKEMGAPDKKSPKDGIIIGAIAGGIIGMLAGSAIGIKATEGSSHVLSGIVPIGYGAVGAVGGAVLGGIIGGTISYAF